MKHLRLAFLFLTGFLITNSTFGQNTSDTSHFAKIFFYRPFGNTGSSDGIKISLNNKSLVNLKNGSQFIYTVLPGDYEISSSTEEKSTVNLRADAGKTYYIRCEQNLGRYASIPLLILADSLEAEKEIQKENLTTQTYVPEAWKKPTNRVGLILGIGIGFEDITFFTMDNNIDVNLSTGGGLSYGVELGFEIDKNFDLSFDLYYQISSLQPTIKEAEGTFSSSAILINPSLIIPIGGEFTRIRVGPGLGLFMGTKLYIDGSKVSNGAKFTWKYSNTFGFIGNLVLEHNIFDKASMFAGMRLNIIRYEFSSSESNYIPNENERKVIKPNGSGINFIIGLNYHF